MNSQLEGINSLRLNNNFTDVTLVVEGKRFNVHRVMLAACSDYFYAMFSSQMLETKEKEIPLMGITANAMAAIIDYVYTSKIKLDIDNVEEILAAACYTQIVQIIEHCVNYLTHKIDLENCLNISLIADRYVQSTLKRAAYRFMFANLNSFAKTADFHELKSEQFLYMLSNNFAVDVTEYELLMICMDWCLHVKASYLTIHRLFQNIRFPQISKTELRELISNLDKLRNFEPRNFLERNDRVDKLSNYYMYAFHEYEKQVEIYERTTGLKANRELLPGSVRNERGMELALLKVGGFEPSGLTNKISYFAPSQCKWNNLTTIPHLDQSNYGTAILDNQLYIVGGSYDVSLKEYIHPFGFKYCPLKNKWSSIARLQLDRSRFTLNAIGTHYLYAVGGIIEIDDGLSLQEALHVSNVERYDSILNVWTYMPKLQENRSQHAAVTMLDSLYISGGLSADQTILNSLWRFDPNLMQWEELAPMLIARCDHVLVHINNKIYACGGWYEQNDNRKELVTLVESYDKLTNEWSPVTNIPSPKLYCGIASLHNMIYFIGGLQSTMSINRATSLTKVYNVDTNEWYTNPKWNTPVDVWEMTCISLYLPIANEASSPNCLS